MRRFVCALLVLHLGLASFACSDDVPRGDAGSGPADVSAPDASDTPPLDVRDVTDATDISDGDDDASPEPEPCEPDELWCKSATVRAGCIGDTGQSYSVECESGQICRDGRCIEGEPCAPGSTIECADEQSLLVCNEMGNDTIVQACPEDQPECVEGACLPVSCSPGVKMCRSGGVEQCNERGTAWDVVEPCAHQCTNAECQFPDYTGCSNRSGCEFYAVHLANYFQDCSTDADCQSSTACPGTNCSSATCQRGVCLFPSLQQTAFGISVTNPVDRPVSVKVTDRTGATVLDETIGANRGRLMPLPWKPVIDTMRSDASYRIVTDGPANIAQYNPMTRYIVGEEWIHTGDTSNLLPTHALGTSYIVPHWKMSYTRQPPYVTIVGTQSNTTVNIAPTAPLMSGGSLPRVLPGATQTISVGKGEVVQYALDTTIRPYGDLTGTVVESDKPVAVFSGTECVRVPQEFGACDHIESQVPPLEQWGKTYIAGKFYTFRVSWPTHEPDYYRVVASKDGTVISTTPDIAGVNGAQLDRGEFLEFAEREEFELSANHPVLLSQFMAGWSHTERLSPEPMGDPAMLLPTPNRQFRARYAFYVPSSYESHVTVRAPTGTELFLDDKAVTESPVAISGTPWSVWRIPVVAGAHTIRGSEPFGLDVYGKDEAISYAYPAGGDRR